MTGIQIYINAIWIIYYLGDGTIRPEPATNMQPIHSTKPQAIEELQTKGHLLKSGRYEIRRYVRADA